MECYQEDVRTALAEFSLPWEKLSGKNILVLGATGLIGGCLVDMLLAYPGVLLLMRNLPSIISFPLM